MAKILLQYYSFNFSFCPQMFGHGSGRRCSRTKTGYEREEGATIFMAGGDAPLKASSPRFTLPNLLSDDPS